MATRKYETMFILKPVLNEEETNAKVEFIKSTLEKQGAVIDAVEIMGSRPLSYKIEKFERGFYVVIYFTAEGNAIKELERIYKITEDVIRSIVIKYERKVEVDAWDNMVKKAKGLPFDDKKLSSNSQQRDRPSRPQRYDRDGGRDNRDGREKRNYNQESQEKQTIEA